MKNIPNTTKKLKHPLTYLFIGGGIGCLILLPILVIIGVASIMAIPTPNSSTQTSINTLPHKKEVREVVYGIPIPDMSDSEKETLFQTFKDSGFIEHVKCKPDIGEATIDLVRWDKIDIETKQVILAIVWDHCTRKLKTNNTTMLYMGDRNIGNSFLPELLGSYSYETGPEIYN